MKELTIMTGVMLIIAVCFINLGILMKSKGKMIQFLKYGLVFLLFSLLSGLLHILMEVYQDSL